MIVPFVVSQSTDSALFFSKLTGYFVVGIIEFKMSVRQKCFFAITERETGASKLGWHGNSTGFGRKNT